VAELVVVFITAFLARSLKWCNPYVNKFTASPRTARMQTKQTEVWD
jgi:hypothetical protein